MGILISESRYLHILLEIHCLLSPVAKTINKLEQCKIGIPAEPDKFEILEWRYILASSLVVTSSFAFKKKKMHSTIAKSYTHILLGSESRIRKFISSPGITDHQTLWF